MFPINYSCYCNFFPMKFLMCRFPFSSFIKFYLFILLLGPMKKIEILIFLLSVLIKNIAKEIIYYIEDTSDISSNKCWLQWSHWLNLLMLTIMSSKHWNKSRTVFFKGAEDKIGERKRTAYPNGITNMRKQ